VVQQQCSLMHLLGPRKSLQSNNVSPNRSMMLSRPGSSACFLKRNPFRPPWLRTSFLSFENRGLLEHCFWYGPHGRFSLAVGQGGLLGRTGTPDASNCPSQHARPPQISRKADEMAAEEREAAQKTGGAWLQDPISEDTSSPTDKRPAVLCVAKRTQKPCPCRRYVRGETSREIQARPRLPSSGSSVGRPESPRPRKAQTDAKPQRWPFFATAPIGPGRAPAPAKPVMTRDPKQ